MINRHPSALTPGIAIVQACQMSIITGTTRRYFTPCATHLRLGYITFHALNTHNGVQMMHFT